MDQNKGLFSLSIDPVTKAHLSDTAKWARWLSIVGMVVLILVLVLTLLGSTVFTLASGTAVSPYPESGVNAAVRFGAILGSVIIVAILFFPLLFLFRFSGQMKTALATNNQEALNASFQYLKMTFRYLGILVLITMVFYALVIVFGIISATSR